MSDNRRGCFRCPNQHEDTCAVIRAGRQELPVELLDQSADGFAIVGDRLSGQIGECLQIRTPGGWSNAEIVRREEQDQRVTLGLRNIEDLPDPRQLKCEASNSVVWWSSRVSRPETGVSLMGTLLLSALGLVLGFWALVLGLAWFC